jgi:hypothetical protein
MGRKDFYNSALLHLAMVADMYSSNEVYNFKRVSRREVNGNFEKLVKEPEKVLRSFSVHGTEIKAYSKKDAIKSIII